MKFYAHSVKRMFLYLCLFVALVFHFSFESGTLVLIASVPGHCLSCTRGDPEVIGRFP